MGGGCVECFCEHRQVGDMNVNRIGLVAGPRWTVRHVVAPTVCDDAEARCERLCLPPKGVQVSEPTMNENERFSITALEVVERCLIYFDGLDFGATCFLLSFDVPEGNAECEQCEQCQLQRRGCSCPRENPMGHRWHLDLLCNVETAGGIGPTPLSRRLRRRESIPPGGTPLRRRGCQHEVNASGRRDQRVRHKAVGKPHARPPSPWRSWGNGKSDREDPTTDREPAWRPCLFTVPRRAGTTV